jgi:hypothetical protein
MKSVIRSVVAGSLVAILSLVGAVSTVRAAEVMLYEISEAVKLDSSKGGKFKGNAGTLFGWAEAGTALCPQFVVDALDKTTVAKKVCGLSIDATGKADDVTGIGPISGTLSVLVQDKNMVDAPEITVITGRISGTINMSPAFREGRPLGTITGKYEVDGAYNSIAKGYKASGTFSGTFRLPFVTEGVSRPQYMMDDGQTVTIDASEYVLRYPAVRLEVTLSPTTYTASSSKSKGKDDHDD